MMRRFWLLPIAAILIAAAALGPALIQATSIELGPAGTTDTTITRSGAGAVQVEGTQVILNAASPTFGTITTTGPIELGAASDTTLARSAAAEATLEGDAIKHAGKQMMWIGASAMKAGVTSPASCGDTYDSGTSDVTLSVCAFDAGATEERAEFIVGMPKSWDEGTVTFIPVSTCAGACAATETLQYELACLAVSDSDTLNGTLGTPQASSKTLQATPTNELLVGAESAAITIGGTPAENDVVHCRISRDTSVDTMTGDSLLIGIKLFWTDNASTLAE